MKLKLNLYKSLKDIICQLRYYTSIDDLPINLWFKIHKERELKYLVKNKFAFALIFFLMLIPLAYVSFILAAGWAIIGVIIKDKYFNESVWDGIYDQFIKEVGLSKEYLEYLELTTQIARLKCDWIIAPTPINKSMFKHAEIELGEREREKNTEYMEIIAAVSKAQGYPVSKVSVREFYAYLKINGK